MKRRQFLRNAATGVAGFLVLDNARSAFSYPADEKLSLALIGVGGRGNWFVGAIPDLGENLVALCDVDETRNPSAYERLPKARKYHDYRRMLEAMGRQLDWGDAGEKKWRDFAGLLIEGSKGRLHANAHNTEFTLLPEAQFRDFKAPPAALPRSPGHEAEWIRACKGGPRVMSHFDYAGPLAELLLLGNVATQFPEPLTFDPAACRVVNHERADAALRREYRPGWQL
jgi:hypothetical protein